MRDLRNHYAEVIRRVKEGESFTVTERDEPVAELTPVGGSAGFPRAFVPADEVVGALHHLGSGGAEELRADLEGFVEDALSDPFERWERQQAGSGRVAPAADGLTSAPVSSPVPDGHPNGRGDVDDEAVGDADGGDAGGGATDGGSVPRGGVGSAVDGEVDREVDRAAVRAWAKEHGYRIDERQAAVIEQVLRGAWVPGVAGGRIEGARPGGTGNAGGAGDCGR